MKPSLGDTFSAASRLRLSPTFFRAPQDFALFRTAPSPRDGDDAFGIFRGTGAGVMLEELDMERTALPPKPRTGVPMAAEDVVLQLEGCVLRNIFALSCVFAAFGRPV